MEPMKVGVIGCGAISDVYISNIQEHYSNVEVISCSDIVMEKAMEVKERYGLKKAYTNEELLADPEVQIVLNLTVPAVHYDLNMKILAAGKHVYSEKPLALTAKEAQDIVRFAKEKNLRVSCAADTFLGPGVQTCRKLIDEGKIGDILGFTLSFNSFGHEAWHPSPMFYYQQGGGPLRDMGPYYLTALITLLGPVDEVCCYTSTPSPKRYVRGQIVDVHIPTHYTGIMKLRNGVIGNINMSFDVWKTKQPGFEIYGTKGMITVPDPNATAGPVMYFEAGNLVRETEALPTVMDRFKYMGACEKERYKEEPLAFHGGKNMRGIGTSEMAYAIAENRPQRASGEMAAHVVDIQESMERSSDENRIIKIASTCERPEAFYPVAEGVWIGGEGRGSFV